MTGQDATNSPIEDLGANFEAGFQAIVNNGSVSSHFEYTDFRKRPKPGITARALKNAVRLKIPPQPLNESDIYQLQKRIAEKQVLPAGFRIYQKFDDLEQAPEMIRWQNHPVTGKRIPIWHKAGRPFRRTIGHAMLITGYDEDLNAFEVLNSFGDEWGDGGYIWIDFDFFSSKDEDGEPLCCDCVYDYQQTLEATFAEMGGEKAVRLQTLAGNLDGFTRLATTFRDGGEPDINFQLPPGEGLDEIKAGDELIVKPGFSKLVVRGNLAADPLTGNTMLAPETGSLKSGDRFKVNELRKVVLNDEGRIEYWAKGQVLAE